MLQITIPVVEKYDETKNEFIYTKKQTIQLEHSLVSLAKWESKWNKPFLVDEKKSKEEVLDYVRCMTITSNVDPNVYQYMSNENIEEINKYIEAPMTATWFSKKSGRPSREVVTSELIYYWMITLEIPFECQKWHLNRLLTLIRVCNEKNDPKKKRNYSDMVNERRSLNAARKAQMKTKG